MASIRTIFASLLNVNNTVIENIDISRLKDRRTLYLDVRPHKRHSQRCPVCGRKCSRYDSADTARIWRSRDFGDVHVKLRYRICRVVCPEHGVKCESVPWAFPDSGFTKEFDQEVTWLATQLSKSAVAEFKGIDWGTVGRCISRIRKSLEPCIERRYDNLINIGIDETSYRKGHRYITVVVNHDSNTVVWAHDGHGKEVLMKFFNLLTPEQLASIKCVTGDGARWIDQCVHEKLPNCIRCIDAFHVVEWAGKSLDDVRTDIWRDLLAELKELQRKAKNRPKGPESKEKERDLAKEARMVKGSTYALGKAPENLTENQSERLSFIARIHPRLFRAYELKEELRACMKLRDPKYAEQRLKKWFWKATHSRLKPFRELGHKIKRHWQNILNTIESGMSNARVEAMNNRIKLLNKRSFGFRDVQNLIDMVLLICSDLPITLPGMSHRGRKA